jgi:glycosyltransferase involved in cell wall biosynthesis
MRPRIDNLLIVSHVVHYHHAGRLFAYGPYAREIDIWADLFPRVVIASPCRNEPPPADCLPFTRSNISVLPQLDTGGNTLKAKVQQVLALPRMVARLCRAMSTAEAIHVRCPGNLGLLAAAVAPLFSRYRIAKYAGQWNGFRGERWPVKLQRALLRSRWWGMPVTVYGQWPNQPPHVHGFFTSMMTAAQVERAVKVAAQKSIASPLRVLFSGRLASEKRVTVLLDAVRAAKDDGLKLDVAIVGDGPERQRLQRQAAELTIQDQVKFIGALPFDQSLRWYDWAHCLVLPSVHSEGWPKVVAEAMCHGLMCVAVDHGQISSMLADRGLLLRSGSAQEIAQALLWISQNPEQCQQRMEKASLWARQYSLEGLRDALADFLSQTWQVTLPVVVSLAEVQPGEMGHAEVSSSEASSSEVSSKVSPASSSCN